MREYLEILAEKYGAFVVAGLIGAVIHRLRNRMAFRDFIGVLFISAFVGFCVGVLMRNYFEATDEVVFVACSIAGVFSKDLLEEIKEIIQYFSVFVKNKLNIRNESNN